jgi:hypothetical protein
MLGVHTISVFVSAVPATQMADFNPSNLTIFYIVVYPEVLAQILEEFDLQFAFLRVTRAVQGNVCYSLCPRFENVLAQVHVISVLSSIAIPDPT